MIYGKLSVGGRRQQQYQEFSQPHKFERRYVFIGEISLVPDWQYAVKQAIDLGWASISRSDYTTMKRSFGKGILVTKNTFFLDEEVVGIPAPLFLLLN